MSVVEFPTVKSLKTAIQPGVYLTLLAAPGIRHKYLGVKRKVVSVTTRCFSLQGVEGGVSECNWPTKSELESLGDGKFKIAFGNDAYLIYQIHKGDGDEAENI